MCQKSLVKRSTFHLDQTDPMLFACKGTDVQNYRILLVIMNGRWLSVQK